jgi:hypothetical protein
MATKKKIKKKQTKAKTAAGKKVAAKRKKVVRKQRPGNKKKAASKRAIPKRTGKTKPAGRRKVGRKAIREAGTQGGRKGRTVDTVTFSLQEPASRAGGQSGDLQGLSRRERADSESVDELLEEGNAFEADVVKGVEEAGDAEGREVHTHEVPEDDVPGEYRDKD